jgi:NitT/TauT family transport system substrate-binding protein
MTFPIRFVEKGLRRWPVVALTALLLSVSLLVSACGQSGGAEGSDGPVTLRLGYFPNVTHATAVVGVVDGIFARALAPHRLTTQTFNAGPAAVEALFSNAVDAAYMGPNPAINAHAKSGGEAIRIISGATSGGAALVVKPGIASPEDLRGKKVASPQLGGTQDVALRAWLKSKGLQTDPQGGGDVSIVPQENAQTLETFKTGQISGAWVPEPWSTRLVQEGGGTVLVDEKTLWPNGQFVTTLLIVRTEFLRQHPDVVRRLLDGQVQADDFVNQQPGEAQRALIAALAEITSKQLPAPLIAAAWRNLEFTNDPIASSLSTSARHAEEIGLLSDVDLSGIYDLTLLNQVLTASGKKEVASA